MVMVCMTFAGYSQLVVTTVTDSDELANALINEGSGVTFVSTTLIGADGSCGTFSGGEFGFGSGILLTSGTVQNALGPNSSESITGINGTPGDPDLDLISAPFATQDAAVLEMVFIPDGDLLEFTYVFGSDEYNEYVCSSFNDAFGFFISGGEYENQNIAILPGSEPPIPVSINNVNNGSVGSAGSASNCTESQLANSEFFVDNTGGEHLEYDGYTVPLAANIPVIPGTEYTIRLAIADAGDGSFDSGVFIEGDSFVSVVCDSGDIALNGNDENTFDVCLDQLPASYDASNTGAGINDAYVYIVTDADFNILAISDDGIISTEGWGVGTYNVYGISYAGIISGLEVGLNADDLTSATCISESNGIFIIVLEPCEDIYDCPALQANYDDACDDGNPLTENDYVTLDCECMGEPIPFDCPDLEANYEDPCDDGNPNTINDYVTTSCECMGEPEVFDCPELALNIGDFCMVDGVNGVIIDDCECFPNQSDDGCQEYVYYLADNTDGESNIYRVDVAGDMAVMTWLKTMDYGLHIAYNPLDDFLYLVRASDGSFRALDVSVVDGAMSDETPLSEPMSNAVAVAINADGKLLIGGSDSDHITSVDIETGNRTPYADADIDGGDLAFGIDGTPYLATRSGGYLYMVVPGFDNLVIGEVSSLVTGLAVSEDGSLLYSELGGTTLTGRASDGSDNGISLDLMLDGSPFTTSNGDLAYGCTDPDPVVEDCQEFPMFYINNGLGGSGSALYNVELIGTEAVLEFLIDVPYSAHIGLDAMEDIVYLVDASGAFIEHYDISSGLIISTVPIDGDIDQLYAVVFNPDDGLLYVGDEGDDEIHSIDVITGLATFYAEGPVHGGDLALQEGTMYLAKRNSDALYTIAADADGIPDAISDATLIGSVPDQTNGMAAMNNTTSLLCARAGTTLFTEVGNTDGTPIMDWDVMLEGEPFLLANGDMASGCADAPNVEEPEPGECYATEVISHIQGTAMGGGEVAENRTDPAEALGEPERTDDLVFLSLGYGGSATYAFGGAVPNEDGDDIEVVETTFGDASCESYPEYADVYVSVDGADFFFAKTVCKSDGFVDISDAGEFDYINFVRIVNEDDLSASSDGFDLDGLVAIHNCDDEGDDAPAISSQSTEVVGDKLSAFPNPANEISTIVFQPSQTSRVTLQIFDMNGRIVSNLFNQEGMSNMTYRLEFDTSTLPNGIYVYKLTTKTGISIQKIMVTH